MRSTSKNGFEESKQPATLASCRSNNSLAGGGLSKKESAISLLSSSNPKTFNNKAVIKTSKKRQSKAGLGSVNSSAPAEEHKSISRHQKNRNRKMVKSTSSVSIRDEASASERIKS